MRIFELPAPYRGHPPFTFEEHLIKKTLMKREKYAVTWRIIFVASVIDQVIAEIIF